MKDTHTNPTEEPNPITFAEMTSAKALSEPRKSLVLSSSEDVCGQNVYVFRISLRGLGLVPSKQLTYPTVGTGKSSSKVTWLGIC